MEPHPRTAAGAHRLRPLNQAQPVRLQADPANGAPTAVELRGRWHTVARVEEVWRLDDGWWRPHPVQRTYFRLALDDGRPLTLYRDQAEGEGGWWLQRY
jgi:hypothetical protein